MVEVARRGPRWPEAAPAAAAAREDAAGGCRLCSGRLRPAAGEAEAGGGPVPSPQGRGGARGRRVLPAGGQRSGQAGLEAAWGGRKV